MITQIGALHPTESYGQVFQNFQTNGILKFLCGIVVIVLITVVLILWILSKDPADAKYATIESVLGGFFGILLAFYFTTKKKAGAYK